MQLFIKSRNKNWDEPCLKFFFLCININFQLYFINIIYYLSLLHVFLINSVDFTSVNRQNLCKIFRIQYSLEIFMSTSEFRIQLAEKRFLSDFIRWFLKLKYFSYFLTIFSFYFFFIFPSFSYLVWNSFGTFGKNG